MAFTFDSIFAVDPNNPANVAKNATITIFDPADLAQSPIAIQDPTGSPLPNPITVDAAGMGPAFQHPTLARVGWKGANFTNYFTSYEGMLNETVAAKSAAQSAAANAAQELSERIAAGDFKGAKGDKGADGSNVLPTDTAIKNAVNDPASQTRAALNETFTRKTSSGMKFPAGARVDRTSGDKYVIGVDDVRSRYFLLNSAAIWKMTTPGLYDAASWAGHPADVALNVAGRAKMVYFKGHYYLSIKNVAGVPGIYRGTPQADPNAEFVWSTALKTMRPGADIITSAFNTDGAYLYWGEYGQPTGGPMLYRSADGTTWENVLGPMALNHVHSVNADPYAPGHVYASFGDSADLKNMRSTNYGAPGSWVEITDGNGSSRQAVQISFDEDYVWYASDANLSGWTAFRLNRATQEWEWATTDWHFTRAVPGGRSGRYVTDLTTEFTSKTVTSATANFTAADKGAVIRSVSSAVPDNAVIMTVTNATTVQMSQNALGTGTTGATITGDQFFGAAFYGAVDPATGIFYCVPNDASFVGNTAGLFAILPGGELRLLKVLGVNTDTEVYIGGGYGWVGQYQFTLLS